MKVYREMKDSGVEWIGEIPSHWILGTVKRFIQTRTTPGTLIKGHTKTEYEPGLYPGFSASGQDIWLDTPMFEGSGIVLSSVGARCGRTFKSDGEWGVVANTQVFFVNPGQYRDFWWYVTNLENWWEKGGSAQPYVQVSQTLQRSYFSPPLHEQQEIVSFLDEKTSLIDEILEKKTKRIELLKELRSSLISEVVTKGLDPDVEMKDSGVEWIGEIPSGWMVPKVWLVVDEIRNGTTSSQGDSGIPVTRIETISGGIINRDRVGYLDPSEDHSKYRLETGDLLFSHINSLEWVGNVSVFDESIHGEMYHGMNLLKISLDRDRCDPRYFELLLKSDGFRDSVRESTNRAVNQVSISISTLKQLVVVVPPLPEQRQIVDYLDTETSRIDGQLELEKKSITLLKELRQSLISEVVTGKIDVRKERVDEVH